MELLQLQPGVAAGDVLWNVAPVPGIGESQFQGQPRGWALCPTELGCGLAALTQSCHPQDYFCKPELILYYSTKIK